MRETWAPTGESWMWEATAGWASWLVEPDTRAIDYTIEWYADDAHLAAELSAIGLVYIHVVDHSAMGAPRPPDAVRAAIRTAIRGTYLLSGGYDRARAEADLAAGLGELVAFGRPFISNPDLVARFAADLPLAQPDFATFYTPGPQGYIDYPPAG